MKTYFTILILCGLASLNANGQSYRVMPADFNSKYSDFGAFYYDDGVVFISNREKKQLRNAQDSIFRYFTDIFYRPQRGSGFKISPRLFAKEITGLLNEGPCAFSPDGNTLYFTGNVDPGNLENTKKIKEYKLGLFICQRLENSWSSPVEFEHNGPKNCNTAHPTLSKDGKRLLFMSNRPGGYGGADLYECTKLENGSWSEPENLGPRVNSIGDEVFPFLDDSGVLYYSSNHIDPLNGMEVVKTTKIDSSWTYPSQLKDPINSAFDDFAYSHVQNGSKGFVSSSRDGQDNVYEFQFEFPEFTNCDESHEPIFCYLIEDVNAPDVSKLPLKLRWNLGDGNYSEGASVEHCYADTGFYHVSLDLIDTLTHQTFSQLTETEIYIFRNNSPRIISADTVKVNTDIRFEPDLLDVKAFNADYYFWTIDDSIKVLNETLDHQFAQVGMHEIALGVSGIDVNGIKDEFTCSTKRICVVDSLYQGPVAKVFPEIKRVVLGQPLNLEPIAASELPNAWCVVVAESKERLTFNNPIFAKIDDEFREVFDPLTGTYMYTVGIVQNLDDAYALYRKLADNDVEGLEVSAVKSELILKNTVQVGNYIQPADEYELNRKFRGLSNVRFEYDSDVILDTSFANLDYIAAMLQLEHDFLLKIEAHTCDMGQKMYNLKLSDRRAQSVLNYLVSKGVPSRQMEWVGKGASFPKVPNLCDDTRSINRRVEFEIQFNPSDEINTASMHDGSRLSFEMVKEK